MFFQKYGQSFDGQTAIRTKFPALKAMRSLLIVIMAAIMLSGSIQVSLLNAFAINPPAAPQSVKATSASYNSIKISWSSVKTASGYVVYRYNPVKKAYERIKVTKAASFTNTGLSTGKKYYYKSRAYKTVNGKNIYGIPSKTVTSKPIPSVPGSIKATRESLSRNKISWNPVSGASGYVVYSYNSSKKAYERLNVTKNTNCTDYWCSAGTSYNYKVRAFRTVGEINVYGYPSAAVLVKAVKATPTTTQAATTQAATTLAPTTQAAATTTEPATTTTEPATTAQPVTTTQPTTQASKVIRCSTTTSVNDSGLMSYLEPLFEKATGYDLQITSNGSGAAIALGRTGDADVLLVHSKADEEKFVSDGYGIKRLPFMYNYFVITGPSSDPAGVKSATSAVDAFQHIAAAKSTFISRGDNSGTHKAELKIWTAAGLSPKPAADKWYISAGQGMGACLTMADQLAGYTLTDTATYLSMKTGFDDLKILIDKDEYMKNTYSLIACNPEKNTGLNFEGANDFIAWMTSASTLNLISNYGKTQYGQQLFFLL